MTSPRPPSLVYEVTAPSSCASGILAPQRQSELTLLLNQTNPRSLRREIRSLIDILASYPLAPEGSTQDVHLPLFTPTLRKELDVR